MQFIHNIITMLKVIYQSKLSSTRWIRKNNTLPKDLIILGNGPSLNDELEELKRLAQSHHMMAVNMFAIGNLFQSLKPSYYFLLDGAFFNFSNEVFEDHSKHPNLKFKPDFEHVQKQINETWRTLFDSSWGIQLVIPQLYEHTYIVQEAKKRGLSVMVFNYTVLKGSKGLLSWFYNRGLGLPQSQNVMNAAIAIAGLIGPRKLYLVGFDHTFHLCIKVDENNQLWNVSSHFYTDKKPLEQRLLNPLTKKSVTLKETFYNLYKVHRSYEIVRELVSSRGISIYNATKGGFVDAFERKLLSEVTND